MCPLQTLRLLRIKICTNLLLNNLNFKGHLLKKNINFCKFSKMYYLKLHNNSIATVKRMPKVFISQSNHNMAWAMDVSLKCSIYVCLFGYLFKTKQNLMTFIYIRYTGIQEQSNQEHILIMSSLIFKQLSLSRTQTCPNGILFMKIKYLT